MKSILFTLLVITSSAFAADWPKVYETALPSIVAVRSFGSICSGALIDKDLVLTAHHCVHYLRPITVQWFSGDKVIKEQRATVSRWNRKNDIAILQLDAPVATPTLKFAPINELKVGEEHATIGHPFGTTLNFGDNLQSDFLFNFTVGRVSKINQDKNFLSGMSLSPGNSGGPVLNEKAELLGVVSAKVARSHAGDIDRIIHPAKVKELVDTPPSPPTWKEARNNTDLTVKHVRISIEDGDRKIHDATDSAELRVYLRDRVIVSYEHSFSASQDDIEYEGGTLGYRWYFETQAKMPWYLATGAKRMNFKNYGDRWFWMFNAKALLFELETGFNFQNGGESYISLGLSF